MALRRAAARSQGTAPRFPCSPFAEDAEAARRRPREAAGLDAPSHRATLQSGTGASSSTGIMTPNPPLLPSWRSSDP